MIKTIIYLFFLLLINLSRLAQPNPETKNGTMRIRKKNREDKTITTVKAKKGAEQKTTDSLKKITF